jgi:WD40 repeat protein
VSPGSVLRGDRTTLLVTATVAGIAVTPIVPAVSWLGLRMVDAEALIGSLVTCCVIAVLMLVGSGSAWVSYSIVRLWLALLGRLPWRLTRFLDDAYRKGVLRQAGSAYQIRHDLVRSHLTRPAPTSRRRRWAQRLLPVRTRPVAARYRRAVRGGAVVAALILLPAVAVASDPRPEPLFTIDSGRHQTWFKLAAGRRVLLTAGGDKHIRLWNVSTGARIGTFGEDREQWAELVNDGTLVTMRLDDGLVRLWDAGTGRRLAETERIRTARDLVMDPAGRTVVTIGADGVARLWQASDGHRLGALAPVTDAAKVVYSRDGATLATIDTVGVVDVWDATTGLRLSRLSQETPYDGVVIAPGARTVATIGADAGTVRLWDTRSGERIGTLEPVDNPNDVQFSPNGDVLTTGQSFTGPLRLWDAATARRIAVLDGRQATFRPGGGTVLTVDSLDGKVRLFDARTGSWITDLDPVTETGDARFVAGGRLLATFHDGSIRLWNPLTGERGATLAGTISLEALSPDGGTLVTVDGGRARLWDVATGAERHSMTQTAPMWLAWFTPDGQTLIVMDEHWVVRLCAVSTGRLTATLDAGSGVDVTADGRTVVTMNRNGTVRLWAVPPA